MALLINERTGGISASVEVDEERDKSGRYAYCWPRDSVLVYKALDFIGFENMTKKLYENFLRKTQEGNHLSNRERFAAVLNGQNLTACP